MKKVRRSDVAFVPNIGFMAHRILEMEMDGLHQHNNIELGLLDAKPVRFLVGNEEITLPVLRLHVLWSLIPHRNIDPAADASWWGLDLPFHTFLSWQLPQDFVSQILQGQMIIDPQIDNGQWDVANFARWQMDFNSSDAERIHSATLEVEARLRRLTVALREASGGEEKSTRKATAARLASSGRRSEADLGRIEKMALFIAERYTEAIHIEDIAGAAGIHPKYAMRLFHRTCGITILQYLTQHRVWHAQRLLATSEQTLNEIAASSGFQSLSRFHEVFKRSCGVSPHDYRKAAGA